MPGPLVEQLRPGGRLVIPVAAPGGDETLTVVEKNGQSPVRTRQLLPVRFVPLLRGTR